MTAELTDTALQEQMLPVDRNDLHQTFARVTQQRAREKQEQAKGADQESPGREPTTDEIRDEQRLLGASFNDARNALRRRLAADARRLKSAAPSASAEIGEAIAEADAAKERADQLILERQAALDSLETQIDAMVNVRLKISLVQSLAMDGTRKKAVANQALDFFLAKQGVGSCAFTEGGWKSSLQDLAYLSALDPYLQEFIGPLEKQAATLIASIRSQAQVARMDLRKFLALLSSERAKRGDGSLLNENFYKGLI